MTSALYWAAWVFTGAAVGALFTGPAELLAATAILAALTWLAWGFRVQPEPTWRTPVYQHEADEWRRAVNDMTETDRAQAIEAPRAAVGLCGDRTDALDEMSRW
ncbi:hypothetical protein [Mycobacterium sp. DL440]|uniref:microaggregate invasion protein 1 n=1 Tax=Mycobacterium sp. DL440 TaxID=2675523 RepID=UPI001421CFA8|nr:hypothetical protein [Mycobacterium sp. DL440]